MYRPLASLDCVYSTGSFKDYWGYTQWEEKRWYGGDQIDSLIRMAFLLSSVASRQPQGSVDPLRSNIIQTGPALDVM